MRWARRKDSNHSRIAEAFVRAGLDVEDVARCAGLGYDLVVFHGNNPNSRVRFVEVKDGAKSPSRRYLTESESRMWLKCRGVWRCVSNEDEAQQVAQELG